MKFVAEACAVEIKNGAAKVRIKNVCTDSRQAKDGDLFFAIRGEKFDGHDFVDEVAAKNVAALVVEKSKAGPARGGPQPRSPVGLSSSEAERARRASSFHPASTAVRAPAPHLRERRPPLQWPLSYPTNLS